MREWTVLKGKILRTAKKVCSKRKKSGKGKPSKWWDDNIKEMVRNGRQERLASKSYLQNSSQEKLIKYQQGRNQFKVGGILQEFSTDGKPILRSCSRKNMQSLKSMTTVIEARWQQKKEIIDAIEETESRNASGRDGIVPESIKYSDQELLKAMKGLFHLRFQKNTKGLQLQCNNSYIHKKGSSMESKNYRTICLLYVGYKKHRCILGRD